MPRPFFKTNKSTIAEIIRVDHAGEFGAQRIYAGQIKYTKDTEERKLIQHMLEQEEEHLHFFNQAVNKYAVRPTLLMPIWRVGGYFIGALSAMVSPKTAMLVTEKVEEVIEEHYTEQIDMLEQTEPKHELLPTLKQFRADEAEHKHIAIEHESQMAPMAPLFTHLIQTICRTAIFLSKKI